MRRNLSVYLDGLRWLAALGVFFYHSNIFLSPLHSRLLARIFASHGPEGVAAFFVLSGFVIRYVSRSKERDWKAYLRARLARMSSVVLLAIAVTIVADAIGTWANPAYYHSQTSFRPLSFADILSSLAFSGEFWSRHVFVGSNEPYLSLGFEVPYYVFFGIVTYLSGYWKWSLIILWMFIAGPKIILYLPLWLLGVVVYDFLSTRKFQRVNNIRIGAALIVAGILLYLVNKRFGWHNPVMFELGPVAGVAQSAAYFFVVGIAVALNIVGFDILAGERPFWNRRVERTIRWLAGGSFTLYVIHEPLLALAKAITPGIVQTPGVSFVGILVIYSATLLLAELGERRKIFYAQLIDLIVPGRLQSVQMPAKP